MKNLDKLIEDIIPEITDIRHALHQIPELAGQEYKSSKFIRAELEKLEGIELLPPYLTTDVVAILRGTKKGKTVALRADIDALSMPELAPLPYASTHPNCMHACGHDGHTAMLLGAAKVLSSLREEISGTIKFIFQPGEEVKAMGRELVNAGVLENPKVDIISAIHNTPGLAEGVFGTRAGAIMASASHFYITLTGKGAHGSQPENSHDPILAGSLIVQALQSIVSRNVNPQDAAVVSICEFNSSGSSSNVIPAEVKLTGTTRALSDTIAAELKERLFTIVNGIAATMNITAEIEYNGDYPVTLNDKAAVELAQSVVEENFGSDKFLTFPLSSMGAEDFSYYLQKTSGVYIRLGSGENLPPLHSDKFDFNDNTLLSGIKYFVAFALKAGRM